MREHSLRRTIIDEMHLRRWPALVAPLSVWQVLRTVDQSERAGELEILAHGGAKVQAGERHAFGRIANVVEFAWERHTEGSSIAAFVPEGAPADVVDTVLDWIDALPGMVVRATHITLVKDAAHAEAVLGGMGFTLPETVSGRTSEGIQFWSDFRLHTEGFGRLLVSASSVDPVTVSRRVQQLQELGNYRNMALLGLPQARAQWPQLDAIEARLREFAESVSDPKSHDDELLEKVASISFELATLSNAIGYRLDATKAYSSLVTERLDDLAPIPVKNFQSLSDFTRRRFLPAERTCAAHGARLEKLTLRAADLTALLRARIETRIESQNAELLLSMERRATEQLRLQQVVEGLSIVAISYYAVGLVAYAAKALSRYDRSIDVELVTGVSIPFVLVAIWFAMRTARKVLLAKHPD